MIADYSRDLLRSGIIEFKAGNRDAARRYIDRALYMSGDHDVLAEAWYWMSQLTDDPAGKRRALENCLAHDLQHTRARRALAILDGKLKPGDIIDPDAVDAASGAATPQAVDAEAQRFMCPKCGGRMTYSPDGRSLVCEYCARHESLLASPRAASDEKDFLLAMATVRGHGKPLAEQVFHCQGCGAQFILPPAQLSITCPYCLSPHVVSFARSPDLLAPDGLLPHAFDAQHASTLLADWLHSQNAPPSRAEGARPQYSAGHPPCALYLPVWTFDLGGSIDYTGEITEQQDVGFGRTVPRLVRTSDSYPVMLLRLPIPASRKLSSPLVHLLPGYDLAAIQLYDPRYLADWPAELYDTPLAEASLDARSQGYAVLKRDMEAHLAPVHLISTSSANLTIDSFRLNLLPVWMTQVAAGGASHLVLINGQTGDLYGDLAARPSHSGGVLSWLADLLNE